MTKYKLKDFESWLNRANSSGMTKEHWSHYLGWYKENPEKWKLTIEKGLTWKFDPAWRSNKNIEYTQSVDNVLWNTILKWKHEVDSKRSNSLQEYLDKKYPTNEIKGNVREINSEKVNQERRKRGIKLLEGEELDLSKYKNLEKFNENNLGTPFTKLILGEKPYLKELCCPNNQLIFLDTSNCPNLEILYCSSNQLTTLDISGCGALKRLNCSNNQLTSLDVSKCPKLSDLYCDAELFTENKLIGLEKTSIVRLNYRSGNQLQKNQAHKFVWEFFIKKYNAIFPEMKLINFSDLIGSDDQLTSEMIDEKIFACCLEVQNRLCENKGEEYEKCLKLTEELKCQDKTSQTYEERKERVEKALNGDAMLLEKLQDLPYLKEEFQFPSIKVFWQRIKTLETKLTAEQKETKKLRSEVQKERHKNEEEKAKLEQKIKDAKFQEREKHLTEINDLQKRVKELEYSLKIGIQTSEKTIQTEFSWNEELRQRDLKIERFQQQLNKQNRSSIKTIPQLIISNPGDASWANLSTETGNKPLSPSQIRAREKQKRQSQEQVVQIQTSFPPKISK